MCRFLFSCNQRVDPNRIHLLVPLHSYHFSFLGNVLLCLLELCLFISHLSHLFSTYQINSQCILKSAGSQVIVLNELIEVACWSHRSTFQSGRSACTWSDLDNPVYHYTILKDFNDKEWECSKCTFMNKVGLDDCLMCNAKAKVKRQGGRTSLR